MYAVPFSLATTANPTTQIRRTSQHALLIGWAQRALPIAVDTRPARNRGYTGPIKSRLDAVTNTHPARKLVNTLSHLSRLFELFHDHTKKIDHTHYLTIRAKSKASFFLASAAAQFTVAATVDLPKAFPSHRKPSLDPHVTFAHRTVLLLLPSNYCAPDKTKQ